MPETMLRQWQMLRLLPRQRGKISTADLLQQLADEGFPTNLRTIQRDLVELCRLFPLACDDQTKPYGWYWKRDAPPFDVPGMDVHTALSFRLAAEQLAHLLPASTRSYLEPHFALARQVLARGEGGQLASWPDNVMMIPSGLTLEPPVIDQVVLETIHQGLISQRCLEVLYHSRGATESREFELHPLGLVYRDSVAFLVATAWHYPDPRQYALHRMDRATLTDRPSQVPPDFDLKTYVRAERAFEFRLGDEPLPLVAAVERPLAVKLLETPLAPEQQLTPLPDGRQRLVAMVADTVQLRLWLRAQGGYIEVLEPPSLRAELAAELRRAAARYPMAAATSEEPAPPPQALPAA